MLRHLACRLGNNLSRQLAAPLRPTYFSLRNQNLQFSRCFGGDLTANWPESIKSFLEKENINKPTLIQEKTLPIALQKKDLVGIARTGSGKTLAFVIPAVMHILQQRQSEKPHANDDVDFEEDQDDRLFRKLENSTGGKKPTCLVLAPTRELASQTHSVLQKFRHLGVSSICLVGGAARSEQVRQLERRGYDVLVATPGRLMDLMRSDLVDLSNIKYLVLDEADRMLDMGFEPQIREILLTVPESRQTLMWSATWPQEIRELASEFMGEFEYVAVDSEILKANPNITQLVEICDGHEKLRRLLDHLEKFKEDCGGQPRTLIFTNTKRMADSLMLQLMRNKLRAITIHGDRTQKQRDDALRLFKEKHCNILVATDVAARGIDISDITHVINYDMPLSIEDYIHRIGRTARHDRKGTSLSFITPNEGSIAPKLIKVLRETKQDVPENLQELIYNRPSFDRGTREHQPYQRNNRRRGSDFYDGDGGRRRGRDFYDGGGSRRRGSEFYDGDVGRRRGSEFYDGDGGRRQRSEFYDDDEGGRGGSNNLRGRSRSSMEIY